MKNKKNLFIVSGLAAAAGTALAAYFFKNKKIQADKHMLNGDFEEEMFFNFSENTSLSYEEAEEKALAVAKEKLGKGAAVVSASDKKALISNIGGSRRYCFLFGAVSDNLSAIPETLLFYVDASTGEVFESND